MHAGFEYRVDSRTVTAKSVHLSRFSIVEQVAISSCLTELHEHHCQFDSAFDNCTVSCEIVLLIQLSVNSIVDACCKHMTSSFLTSPDNSPKESAPLLVTRSDTCTPTQQRFQHTGVQFQLGENCKLQFQLVECSFRRKHYNIWCHYCATVNSSTNITHHDLPHYSHMV
jgi:hypothetical protein